MSVKKTDLIRMVEQKHVALIRLSNNLDRVIELVASGRVAQGLWRAKLVANELRSLAGLQS